MISSGSTFWQELGYSRAVVDDEWIFVSGTTGFNYRTMTISDSLSEQTEQYLDLTGGTVVFNTSAHIVRRVKK